MTDHLPPPELPRAARERTQHASEVPAGEVLECDAVVIVGSDYTDVGTPTEFAYNARIALHVRVHYGRDPHHITEAEYKAVARALRAAVEPDPRITGIPSTKGAL